MSQHAHIHLTTISVADQALLAILRLKEMLEKDLLYTLASAGHSTAVDQIKELLSPYEGLTVTQEEVGYSHWVQGDEDVHAKQLTEQEVTDLQRTAFERANPLPRGVYWGGKCYFGDEKLIGSMTKAMEMDKRLQGWLSARQYDIKFQPRYRGYLAVTNDGYTTGISGSHKLALEFQASHAHSHKLVEMVDRESLERWMNRRYSRTPVVMLPAMRQPSLDSAGKPAEDANQWNAALLAVAEMNQGATFQQAAVA
ncbi:hypothetical protein HNP46_000403 [Pseudomonas nitritireducens]|uniref:Uncharacterized protein n=1 Tax=Pseudomonas nitroreducens TaxID=46680 RepID=A0A7W7NZU4_PSENT|nr:hypothetical protein [Pseudomonas nitritireducens]MBB4861592.1 hypothetical protein [Pseudomonas nitritireducens]